MLTLINGYYIICSNLTKTNKQTNTVQNQNTQESKGGAPLGIGKLSAFSFSASHPCLHPHEVFIFLHIVFIFPYWRCFFPTLAENRDHCICILEGYHHWGKGNPSTPPSASWKQLRNDVEWLNSTLNHGDKASQLMDYVSRSMQLMKFCDPGQKHTAGVQMPSPWKRHRIILIGWAAPSPTTSPPNSYVQLLTPSTSEYGFH